MACHSKWAKVKHFKGAIDAKRGKIFAKLSRQITAIPEVTVSLDNATAGTVSRLLEALDDHDDVQQVYANAEFPESRG